LTGTLGVTGASTLTGNVALGGTLDMNGAELVLDADADTSITADTDDRIDFKTGGTDRLQVQSTSGNNVVIADGLTLTDGNLIVANGHGIDFSATGDPTQGSGTSELLDDYEEGTWTPTLLGSSSHPSVTTSVAAGKFVRIGGLVFIQWNMIITNVASSGSGNAQVGGLPYAMVGNTYQGYIGIMYNDVWSNETQKGYIPNGGAYISLVPTGRTQTNLGVGTVSTGYFGGGGSYTIV
jgi:hypothetical protein